MIMSTRYDPNQIL